MARRTSAVGNEQPSEHSVLAGWERDVLEGLPDGVAVIDAMGRVAYANRQLEILTGYHRNELMGRPIEQLVPARLRAIHRQDRRRYAARPRPRPMGSPDRDFRLRRKDGTELPVDIALGLIGPPRNRQIAAVVRDATALRELESDLIHKALHDPLTDLANRTLFFDRLHQAMLRSQRDQRPVALVMLDLDSFKTINDAFGHAAGDAVLQALAGQLQMRLRATDTVARLGGDEFAWILPNVAGQEAAVRKVRGLLRSLDRSCAFDGNQIVVDISAGMALFPRDGDDADALMRRADLALYTAKRQGGGLALVDLPRRDPRAASKGRRTRRT